MLAYSSALVTAPTATATITCPASAPLILSGGYSGLSGVGADQPATASFPTNPGTWTVVLAAAPAANWAIYAVCSK